MPQQETANNEPSGPIVGFELQEWGQYAASLTTLMDVTKKAIEQGGPEANDSFNELKKARMNMIPR